MPLPLLAIGVIGALAATGVGAGIKGAVDSKGASDTNADAERIIRNAQNRVNISRKSTFSSLEALGREKITTVDLTAKRFLDTFTKIKNVEFENSKGLEEINKLKKEDGTFLQELKSCSIEVANMLVGGVAGLGGGALAAFGAYSATMTFAAASTGTAIASLSGVAATNATLAFLGGGSLAAGGAGMAGGAMVLGGLVAGPALAVFGIAFALSASKKLDQAYTNHSKAREFEAQSQNIEITTNLIRRRAYMFQRLLIQLTEKMDTLLENMETIVETSGTDYREYSESDKKCIAANYAMMKSIKSILDTSILTDKGELEPKSEKVAQEVSASLANA